MIGHRSLFRKNDDLPLRRGPVVKKKPPFSNVRALITSKIMRSGDAQCNILLILLIFLFPLPRNIEEYKMLVKYVQ